MKAWSYPAEIRALLNDFPFGKIKTQVGVMLQEAMLINGFLYNSESWHGNTKSYFEELAIVDKNIMFFLPLIEFLHLESGAKPEGIIISSQRMNYLKFINMKNYHELIKHVYEAQKKDLLKGDWTELVNTEMVNIRLQQKNN